MSPPSALRLGTRSGSTARVNPGPARNASRAADDDVVVRDRGEQRRGGMTDRMRKRKKSGRDTSDDSGVKKPTLEKASSRVKTDRDRSRTVSGPGRQITRQAPRTKQEQRDGNLLRPSPVLDTTPPPIYPAHLDPPGWPRIGLGDATTDDNLRAVEDTWSMRRLQELHRDLLTEQPRRQALINTVERQVVRCELYDFMGGAITTKANIYLDGQLQSSTTPRIVKLVDTPDR